MAPHSGRSDAVGSCHSCTYDRRYDLGQCGGNKGRSCDRQAYSRPLGIGPGWVAIQRAVDDRVEMVFLPPEHRESLKGSLAPHIKASVPPDEWQRVRERGWHEAATGEREAPSSG